METIRTDIQGGIASLVLDRPASANALDSGLVEALIDTITGLSRERPKMLVLSGAGAGFCGGFDFDGVAGASEGDLALRFLRIETLLQLVHYFPVPTVAMAHGYAWGAGADLFCACRARIAAPDTRFSFPGARFGVVLGTRRLANLVGMDAALAVVTGGKVIPAVDAFAMGLATVSAEKAEWPACLDRMIETAAAMDQETLGQLLPRLLQDSRDEDMAALARSVGRPGLKARMLAYAQGVQRARARGSSRKTRTAGEENT